jgi:tRNA-uridine 2-sulfurtransferase
MKIAVGISGGVDSAVAAFLCKENGHDVVGVAMKLWDDTIPFEQKNTAGNACFGPEEVHDIEDARHVCATLGIPLHVIDCKEHFRQKILSYFSATYKEGKTPNPCVYCNQQLKFGVLPELLRNEITDFDSFATGHYARTQRGSDGTVHLLRGTDLQKDQSYFLYRLSREQLQQTIFPIGHLTKKEVREIAYRADLHVWNKEESQDFYSGDYRDLIDIKKDKSCQGPIVNVQGEKLGTHRGIWNYTIGQRKGLGITSPLPLYVTEIRPQTNTIVVGALDSLSQNRMVITDFNQLEELPGEASCRVRSSAPLSGCTIRFIGPSAVLVEFIAPVNSVCPGQSAVLYKDDVVIGGGIIEP